MLSYWEKKYWFPKYDYCIVGSGIVGLTTALLLQQARPDSKIAVVERSCLPLGASTKNAGFACYGTVGEILDDLSLISEEEVIDTIALRWKGLQLLRSIHKSELIRFSNCGGCELFRTEETFESSADSLSYINKILFEATGEQETIQIKEQTVSSKLHIKCLFNPLEGKLNPALLVQSLLAKVRLLGVDVHLGLGLNDFTRVGGHLLVNLGQEQIDLQTNQLLFATNAFSSRFFPQLDIVPARNQVFVTEPIPDLKVDGTYHLDKGYIYFRNIGNRLLIGGARHLAKDSEMTTEYGPNDKITDYLSEFVRKDLDIKSYTFAESWSGIIATGETKNPILELIGDGVFIAARLGGMGVATGSAVAQALVDIVLDK